MKTNAIKHILYSLFILIIAGCTAIPTVQIGHDNAKKISRDDASQFAIYAMMASNAYLNSERTYFPLEDLGWIKIDLHGKPTLANSYTPTTIFGRAFSNLQFDIWEDKNSNKTVISFKGTDEKFDWIASNLWLGPSISYKSAKKHVERYQKSHPERTVTVTGHSLGGGLALSSSLWLGVDAYAINPSPRIFDGWKNHKSPAIRQVVYQDNEVLAKIRSFWPKFTQVINEDSLFQTNFNFNGASNHRADYIAEGIMRCASNNQPLSEFAKRIPIKIKCNM